jgi:hypothetical protein
MQDSWARGVISIDHPGGRKMMRLGLAAMAAVAALAFMAPAPAAAGGYAPWCAVITNGSGNAYWDCHYPSVEACAPTVLAGNRGFCNPNPAFGAPRPVPHRRHWRRY